VALLVVSLLGLAHHFREEKEDWRGAAAHVAARAGRTDPILFVHFGGALAFEHYFIGLQPDGVTDRIRQPLLGLPQTFRWEDGYHAPYRVGPADVQRLLPSLLADQQRVWLVLSHDDGRGSGHGPPNPHDAVHG
jgi:hypothetical protein